MSTKISALTAAGTLDGTEIVPVVQGGTTERTTTQAIADLPTQVVAYTADASLPAGDRLVFVDTTSGVVDLTLPTPGDDGRQFAITKTNTGANKITLVRNGSEDINGAAASYDLPGSDAAAIGRWHVVSDGTDWWVF